MTDPTVATPDDDDERTTVVDRSAAEEPDDGNETVVVDRARHPADEPYDGTVVVDRSAQADDDGHDGTVVVDRSLAAEHNDAHDGTVVVDRSAASTDDGDGHDGTVVVDRSVVSTDDGRDDAHDGTVVVDRSAPADDAHDGTIVVPRAASEKSKSASRSSQTSRRGRRRITLPPVEPGFGPDPVDAVGAGAVENYSPRTIAAAPALTPAIPLGADATRAPAPSMPSVRRRSTRLGAIALGGFALACVVSVVGLATIVVTLIG